MKVGDRVTNARGWSGQIHRIVSETAHGLPYQTPDGKYYWVWWHEREHNADPLWGKTIRRHPICGMTCEQIWKRP